MDGMNHDEDAGVPQLDPKQSEPEAVHRGGVIRRASETRHGLLFAARRAKPWHASLGALLLASCFLIACDDAAIASDDRAITITYWTRSWWGDPAQYQGDEKVPVWEWQRRQIARFEAEHPGVKIDIQVDPGGRGDKIRMAFAGGVAPDVFHGAPDTEFITWANLGLLEAIDPYLTVEDRADIFPAALQTVEHHGRHYAWPLYNHALGVAINRDLFRERGLEDRIPTPEDGWTMAEFEELAEALTFDRDGDGRTDVYGVGLHALDANHVFQRFRARWPLRARQPGRGRGYAVLAEHDRPRHRHTGGNGLQLRRHPLTVHRSASGDVADGDGGANLRRRPGTQGHD